MKNQVINVYDYESKEKIVLGLIDNGYTVKVYKTKDVSNNISYQITYWN